jgi:AmmeMemoRadiSam system protein B/AmmeMemoRadiSam system protein A
MRTLLVMTFLITGTMNILSQNRPGDREPVAAGRFYSANKESLTNDLANLFATCIKAKSDQKIRAIISPHAGYVFSGKISASAFTALPKDADFKNIFIIGSSHVMSFDGASVYDTGDYLTPLGKSKVNLEIADKLKGENRCFNFPVTSHLKEHSIEVQIPFIQYYFKNQPAIIPIIIGTDNRNKIREIANALKPFFTPDNLFIISSDFSHYPSYKDANETDRVTADAIVRKNSAYFIQTLSDNASKGIGGLATSMCGWTSGLVLLDMVENNPEMKFIKIAYSNSGDSQYGNKDEVVGYNALELVEETSNPATNNAYKDELNFTKNEAALLISIARNSIKLYLTGKTEPANDPDNYPPVFRRNMGAFVTLKIDGNLRGCIGRFTSPDPLYKVVSQMAKASAFEDSRFMPLTMKEFEKTEIEISVLGPLRKISNISEIVLGKHGIYIKKGIVSGTMLPQVATENKWTVEQFLGYTSREKAGLGWDGWKNADIFIYDAVVLNEK